MEVKVNNINKFNHKIIEKIAMMNSINVLKKMNYIDTSKAKKSIVQIQKIAQ